MGHCTRLICDGCSLSVLLELPHSSGTDTLPAYARPVRAMPCSPSAEFQAVDAHCGETLAMYTVFDPVGHLK